MSSDTTTCTAVVEWDTGNGITEIIADELKSIGHRPILINPAAKIPPNLHFLITFGPYGKLLPFLQKLEELAPQERPTTIYWNTEGIPDLRLPWLFVHKLGQLRTAIDLSLETTASRWLRALGQTPPLSLLHNRMLRYRYVGDLYYAYQKGWLNMMADSSAIYAKIRSDNGLPTLFVPWGSTPRWYADLNLKRDIDVLWIGKRATRRRDRILTHIRERLEPRGVKFHVADSIENPFIFGEERTHYFNRSKITLNITRTWYDDNFSRFTMAAPNRSMIVSETLLPHCPPFEAGKHYIEGPVDTLADQIYYYLQHEEERQTIVDNCFKLVTEQLTFAQSMAKLLAAASENRQNALGQQ